MNDFLGQVKALKPDMPVIGLTAEENIARQNLLNGFDLIFYKPVEDIEIVLDACEKLMQS